MKNSILYASSVILLALMLTSTIAVFRAQALWTGYVKPSYPDYAPSGMPDFDEKQDVWGPNPGVCTWCVPVAVADSLWWLDSKYESIYTPSPVPPPTVSDHYSLVTAYGPWDDHDTKNVDPLVRNLAALMHTDVGHVGTLWVDVQPGIQAYLVQQGVQGSFEVHGADYPDFTWIDTQVEKCQDVELFLEFWQFTGGFWYPITQPSFESGHCVACAGADIPTSQVLVSDPYYDAFESGLAPGRSPVPHVHVPPGNSTVHNDAQYVSQDAYTVVLNMMLPPIPGYPPMWELQNYWITMGLNPSWHAFIRGAVATSPLGTHDVAVTNVTTSKTGCTPMPTVGQSFNVTVTVTVENHGSFDESTINVTTYANMPPPQPTIIIGSKIVSLDAGMSTTVTFTWSTTGVSYANYTISAYADLAGDADPADNTFVNGDILVTIPGDINGDKFVNAKDAVLLGGAFGSQQGQPTYSPNADINGDGWVNAKDAVILGTYFGQSWT